jgi:hypothetical protein
MSDPKSSTSYPIVGKYAYRFTGYVMKFNVRYYLVGVGIFEIDADGRLSGSHQSSLSPLQGQEAALTTGAYNLAGLITVDANGTGNATIHFVKTGGDGENVDGKFFVQAAGSADRLWLISAGATLPNSHDAPADELVTLEAVRM